MTRLLLLLPPLWLGLLLTVAGVATPAAFAVLERAQAGRVAARVLLPEAWLSLLIALLLLAIGRLVPPAGAVAQHRRRFDERLLLATLACTLLGYFAVLPLMELARTGQGVIGFAQLHAVSAAFYALKLLLVAALAWRAGAALSPASSS